MAASKPCTVSGERRADFARMSLSELVDYVVSTHHAFLWREMPRIQALLRECETASGDVGGRAAAVGRFFATLCQELTVHLRKEEEGLFPALRASATKGLSVSFRRALDSVRRDHEETGEKLILLQTKVAEDLLGSDGPPSLDAARRALEAFVEDTERHVSVETDWLLPAAERVIDAHR